MIEHNADIVSEDFTFKELLNIPEGYEVLFLQGGASLQFCMAPFNLMKSKGYC